MKLSQQELADKLHVAQSTVGMWESGKRTPKLDDINRMSKVLNITVHRLLSNKKEEEPGPDQKIEITKNEIFIDGDKVDNMSTTDITEIVKYIKGIKGTKPVPSQAGPSQKLKDAKKILIIDDEQDMCELLYSYLVPHNYKVFLTFNGQMGLEYFDTVKPDVVLLDLSLPDIDGPVVLDILRKISNVPVIVITAHPEDVADIHLQDLKINGFIEKPFSLEEVLNTLKHIIGE